MKVFDDDKLELADVLCYARDMLIDVTDRLDEERYYSDDIKEIYDESLEVCKGEKCKYEGYCSCIIDSLHINTIFQRYNQIIVDIVDKINPTINRILDDYKEHWDSHQQIEARKIEGKHEIFINYDKD